MYTLDYYLRLAEQIVESGAHVLAIKDMAGLMRPEAAERLVSALRERFDLPVHVHTHDTAGGQLATLTAAARAGADAVDVAAAPLAGNTSQPPLSALVAAMEHTDRDTGLSLEAVTNLEPYWESLRAVYQPFESGLTAPTGRVYEHEIPGGQLSNLRQQAIAVGQGDQFEEIEAAYAAANRILGRPPKVTPSSKAVGDLALALVAAHADPAEFEANPQDFDIPDSVIGFLAGELGNPPGGWPEPFRSKVLQGRAIRIEDTPLAAEDHEALAADSATRRAALNRLLFPGPTRTFKEWQATYGNLAVLDTLDYFYGLRPETEHIIELERGVHLFVELEAVGSADDKGMRTVMLSLNGHLRPMVVRDHTLELHTPTAERADLENPGHVPAPFSGAVTVKVEAGERVVRGQQVAVVEAMKMEAAITAPVDGEVVRIAVPTEAEVSAGDLLMEIR